MKLFKLMWRPKDHTGGDVTPEAQKIYEEQLIQRARTGRMITLTVCVLNMFVATIVAMCGMGWLLFGIAVAGLVFSVKGRLAGRIMQVVVCFFFALIAYSVIIIVGLRGACGF